MSEILYLRMEELELGLVSLLRASWILATVPIIIACLPLPGLGWFRKILLGFAKRGKILQSNSKLTVPQRFFSHFYVVAIFWTTILLIAVWLYAIRMLPSLIEQDMFSTITSHLTGGSQAFPLSKSLSTKEHVYNVWLSVFLLLLMEVQVVRRFYETIYVFNYSPSARMHIFGYLAGLFFYTAAPLSMCCSFAPEVLNFVKNMVAEFIVKGKDRMLRHEVNVWMFVTPFLKLPWFAWLGAAIFLWGWVHQLRCHEILGSLREKTEKLEEYVIPYGDWFEYVSSPHYSAEIVIYGGLVVASGGADLSLWLLFAFVVANLVFAATETQRWYRHKFDDYPQLGVGLVSLLRTAWIVITLPIVVGLHPLPGLRWLHTTLSQISERGKIVQSNTKLTVPQKFFSHFYAVAILWTTFLLVGVWSYAIGGDSHPHNVWLNVFLLVLMEFHLLRRFYETIYVFNYSPSARMHILTYLLGTLFYILAPLSLCCNFAPQVLDFVKRNGHMSMPKFNNMWMCVTPFLRLPWYTWIGALIFLWGWIHQLRCHQILGSLRDKTEKQKDKYVIPYGDWFEYVSSPHYTAEIVIYGGLLVASGGLDVSLWLLFAFVVSNLVFTATETQAWYRHKFDNYPRNRYIIFPFVY
ncbi:hypothetical protein LXL04_025385 [Taraxacum kok-saghyz]